MGKRVLIVEDEPSIVVSLEYLLARAGYAVRIATTGTEAWLAVKSWQPHLVLLDLMLPEVSGVEICRRVRADPALGGIRVIMLTAKGGSSEIEQGIALGADAYVTKPFGTRGLMERIAELLNT